MTYCPRITQIITNKNIQNLCLFVPFVDKTSFADKSMQDSGFLLKDECYSVIGCAMEVHSELGCGFLEAVYQEALAIEFERQRIPFVKEKILAVTYKGIQLSKNYQVDFVCFGEIILELKAVDGLTSVHTSQILNYLKASGLRVGLLINFGMGKLQYKRLIK